MPPSKAQRAATVQRRQRNIDMVLAGVTDWQKIADALGYASRGAAHTDYTRAMEQSLAQCGRSAEVARQLELDRLDRVQLAYWTKALGGDVDAAKIVLMCSDRRRKITGTDRPQQVEVITVDAVDAEIKRLTEELGPADLSALTEPSADELTASD